MHTTGQKLFNSAQIIPIGILKHFLSYNIDSISEGSCHNS